MIELFDNGNGTLSLVLTMIDHAARRAPSASSASGGVLGLASIGRELPYNGYQGQLARPSAQLRGLKARRRP